VLHANTPVKQSDDPVIQSGNRTSQSSDGSSPDVQSTDDTI